MQATEKILKQMRQGPNNARYRDLCKVCDEYFGTAKQKGSSHRVYEIGLPGEPPINIQEGKNGKAKPYQVKQVLRAIEAVERSKAREELKKDKKKKRGT